MNRTDVAQDVECNRYDSSNKSQGMFLKGKALKAKQEAEAGEKASTVLTALPCRHIC